MPLVVLHVNFSVQFAVAALDICLSYALCGLVHVCVYGAMGSYLNLASSILLSRHNGYDIMWELFGYCP